MSARAAGLDELTDSPPTPSVASRALDGWGFLVQPDLPDRPGPAFLLVAIRQEPELTHFDPETIDYWTSEKGIGRHARLTRDTALPVDSEFSWGTVRLADRLHATNEYLTFGGHLASAKIGDLVVAVFTSPAPILRRGGHSQGWDDVAENLGAFFGRVKIAIDYVPGFETTFGGLSPETRCAAFFADLVDRLRSNRALREAHPLLWKLAVAEERRLGRDAPVAWSTGQELAASLRPI